MKCTDAPRAQYTGENINKQPKCKQLKKKKKHCCQLNKNKNLLLTAENMLQIQNTPPHF